MPPAIIRDDGGNDRHFQQPQKASRMFGASDRSTDGAILAAMDTDAARGLVANQHGADLGLQVQALAKLHAQKVIASVWCNRLGLSVRIGVYYS